MVPVEPISLSIGIATLFTTCVDCFEYFKAAKGFEQRYEVLLVKLEYQQERLLVWGDLAGVHNENHDSDRPVSESELQREDLAQKCLRSIQNLLKDGENLKAKYGLRPYTPANDTIPRSGISTNALKRLRLRLSRQSQGPSILDKTRWAIHDATDFAKLVGDIRDLIDILTVKVPVSSELQEQKVQDDIASMVDDIQSLHLFQEACKDDYPKWSTAASAAIDASEVATLDNRLAEERLDYNGLSNQGKLSAKGDEERISIYFGDSKVSVDRNTQIFFMLTEPCRAQNTETPCDQLNLGTMSYDGQYSFIAPGSVKTHSAPGYRITRYIRPELFTSIDLEKYIENQHIMRAHAIQEGLSVPEYDGRYRVQVYIYCPPCACQVATALDICRFSHQKMFVEFRIRVDYRQQTCCSSSVSRIDGLNSINEYLRKEEKSHFSSLYRAESLEAIDREWLERQIWEYTEEGRSETLSPNNQLARIASFHKEEESCAGIILLGEADYIVPLVGAPPFQPLETGRLLRETQIFRNLKKYSNTGKWYWERQFIGLYSSKDPLPAKRPADVSSNIMQTLEGGPPSSKRSKNSTTSEEKSS